MREKHSDNNNITNKKKRVSLTHQHAYSFRVRINRQVLELKLERRFYTHTHTKQERKKASIVSSTLHTSYKNMVCFSVLLLTFVSPMHFIV